MFSAALGPSGGPMVQKVTEVVGTSKESFAKAAENAVATAAKTVRNLRWFRVCELEGQVQDQRVSEYHATVKIYFDLDEKG
jgi:flavin-binding protein dodecin